MNQRLDPAAQQPTQQVRQHPAHSGAVAHPLQASLPGPLGADPALLAAAAEQQRWEAQGAAGATSPLGVPAPHPALGQASAAPYQRYREMTIDELLLENRIIFLVGTINYSSATTIIMKLLHLQNQKKGVDIHLYINSPGGSVDDTLAIYDTMLYLNCDISTYCIGRAQSGAALVLATGTKGKRYILPHARVMIHQPYGGVGGQASDVAIQAEEILKAKNALNEIFASHTGQPLEQIEKDSERDKYFSAEEAKAYGLVDDVLSSVPEEGKP